MSETCSVCRGMGVCPRCGGYGRDDDGDRCPACGGDGQCPAPSCHEGTVYYDEPVLQTKPIYKLAGQPTIDVRPVEDVFGGKIK